MSSDGDHREATLSQFLDVMRQPQSTQQDRQRCLDTHPELAAEALGLLETEELLQAAVADWKSIAESETVVFTDACSLETADGASPGPNSQEALPETFGRYRILRRLGGGGMGTVYEAEDPDLQRKVAIKLPHFGGSAESQHQSRLRFLREARATAAIEHPNVCPIYDVGEGDGRPFVIMALVEGGSLAGRLQATRIFEPSQAVQIVEKLAIGLSTVHGHGVIHRDLKPANILIRSKDGEPILTDFGLAQTAHDDENLTADGTILGTPAYMAPEQANPSMGQVTEKSDIYSLGVILLEMITGQRPFSGSPLQILTQVSTQSVPRASALRSDIDPTLDAIIARATARDQSERFATADEFARALVDWQRHKPLHGTSTLDDGAKRQVRTRRLVHISIAAVLAVVCIVGTAFWIASQANERAPAARGLPANGPVLAVEQPETMPPIRGSIDVQVWFKDETNRPGMRLNHPSVLPLAPGDWIRIEVDLNRPVYVYLVWIDTEGKASPLYPWIDYDWTARPETEQRIKRLSLPEAEQSAAPLGGGPAGIETLMLLTRDTPLPADADTLALFAGLPTQRAIDTQSAAWFENGKLVRDEVDRGPVRLDQAREIDNPVLQTQSLLKSRLQSLFPYTRSVSFANRGD